MRVHVSYLQHVGHGDVIIVNWTALKGNEDVHDLRHGKGKGRRRAGKGRGENEHGGVHG